MMATQSQTETLWATAMSFGARHRDPVSRMLFNPGGSYDFYALPRRAALLVPATAWYAAGRLWEDDPEGLDDLVALARLQYPVANTPFDGTFPIFANAPHPSPVDPEMWVEYDPNWRQFVGSLLELTIVGTERIGRSDAWRILEQASHTAASTDPDDRIDAGYTNIALMRAWHDVTVGLRTDDRRLVSRGRDLRDDVLAGWSRHQAFPEHNSPTYLGISLYALGLWVDAPPEPAFIDAGRTMLEGLATDVAQGYHPTLRNLAGPYSRAYGLDMTSYVSALGVWLATILPAPNWPLPDLDHVELEQGHDLLLGAVTPLLPSVTHALGVALDAQQGGWPRAQVRQTGHNRTATNYLDRDLMYGAEANDIDWRGWEQYVGACAHWANPDGSVGSLSVHSSGPLSATADEHGLDCSVPKGVRTSVKLHGCMVEHLAPDELTLRGGTKVNLTGSRAVSVNTAGELEVELSDDNQLGISLLLG